jgi:hypothetical protein
MPTHKFHVGQIVQLNPARTTRSCVSDIQTRRLPHLLVSHWEVETNSAVTLMTGTFAALAASPDLSLGEALRQSILAMINHPQQPNWVEPKYWAPFVVVGEPAKPTH